MASGSGDDGTSSSTDIPRGLINRTGNPIGRGSRLPSVRGHRDLTLGGIQRKVYTPNLAAIKKANSKEDVSKITATKAPSISVKPESGKERSRGRSERGRGRGRGKGQVEDRTIQLQSEFAYGPMGGSSSGWSRNREGGGGGGGGGGSRHTEADSAGIQATMKHSKGTEDDKKLLETLMRDSFISDLSSGDPNMAPIRLPLGVNRSSVKLEVKNEIKEEAMEIDETCLETGSKPDPALGSRRQSPPSVNSVKEILNAKSEKGELLFLQFPDTLPGLPSAALSEDQSKTSSDSKEDELLRRLNSCQLKDCNEGYMGKLRVRKSGKTELILGENVMEVLSGIPINFHQELVSIRTDDTSGQMVVLGPVRHKLVVTPDYNNLINQISKYS